MLNCRQSTNVWKKVKFSGEHGRETCIAIRDDNFEYDLYLKEWKAGVKQAQNNEIPAVQLYRHDEDR